MFTVFIVCAASLLPMHKADNTWTLGRVLELDPKVCDVSYEPWWSSRRTLIVVKCDKHLFKLPASQCAITRTEDK